MKKIILLLLILSIKVNAQFGRTDITDFKDLETEQIVVILPGKDDMFTDFLKNAIETHWEGVSDFKFVFKDDINDETFTNSEQLFISEYENDFSRASTVGNFKNGYTSFGIMLFKGDVKKDDRIKPKEVLAYAQFPTLFNRESLKVWSTRPDEEETEKWKKKRGNMSKFQEKITGAIQIYKDPQVQIEQAILLLKNHVSFVFDKDLTKNLNEKDFLKIIAENRKERIHDKTILVPAGYLDKKINSEKSLGKVYDHSVRFVETIDVEDTLRDQEAGFVYIRRVSVRSLNFFIAIDTETSEILYGQVAKGMMQLQIPKSFFENIN